MAKQEENVYVLVQEGGSSTELYLHVWDTEEEAEQDRKDCGNDGAYSTSPIIAVPKSLADHPQFSEVVEAILRASLNLECVD